MAARLPAPLSIRSADAAVSIACPYAMTLNPLAARMMSRDQPSIDRFIRSRFTLVAIEPPAFNVAAHHVDPAVFRIAITFA
jgi:hypothetical protein